MARNYGAPFKDRIRGLGPHNPGHEAAGDFSDEAHGTDAFKGVQAEHAAKMEKTAKPTQPRETAGVAKTEEEMQLLIDSSDEVSKGQEVGRSSKGIFQDSETGKYYSGGMWNFGEEMSPDTIRNPFDESVYDVKWKRK